MSRSTSLLIVTAFWVMIFLPGLGSLEIKGEEGRRILPAVTMLETGNYIVPQVGPYFRKPP
jgi:4-amino-4-deoxy-L-arabinose transferase-like glycosyltransferase